MSSGRLTSLEPALIQHKALRKRGLRAAGNLQTTLMMDDLTNTETKYKMVVTIMRNIAKAVETYTPHLLIHADGGIID